MSDGRITSIPDPRRWAALAVVCAATFILILDGSIVFVAIPSMVTDLALTPTEVQWVLSSYLLTFGGLLLLGGRMADLLGRRRIFILGGALLAASSLLCGFAWSGEVLIGARVLQGAAAAIMAPTALSILTTVFREGPERNKALGIWSSAGGVGGTTGALLGGPLTEGPGWGWIFFVNVPVAVVMILAAPLVLGESYNRGKSRTFDVAGAVTSTAAIVALVYAIVEAPAAGWLSGRTLGLVAASVVLFLLFIGIEARSAAPLFPLKYMRSRSLMGGNVVIALIGACVFGAMGFLITQYAQVVLKYSPVEFGFMYAVMTVLSIVGSVAAGGPLVTRFGPRPVAVGALLLMGVACLVLTNIEANGSFASDMLLGMLLFGPGLGAGWVASTIASMVGIPDADAGLASGLNNTAFHTGGGLGIAILTSVAVSNAVGADPATAMTAGFQSGFAGAAIFAAVGIVAALILLTGARQRAEVKVLVH